METDDTDENHADKILTLLLPLDTIIGGSLVGLVQDMIEFREPQPEDGHGRGPDEWTPTLVQTLSSANSLGASFLGLLTQRLRSFVPRGWYPVSRGEHYLGVRPCWAESGVCWTVYYRCCWGRHVWCTCQRLLRRAPTVPQPNAERSRRRTRGLDVRQFLVVQFRNVEATSVVPNPQLLPQTISCGSDQCLRFCIGIALIWRRSSRKPRIVR